MRGIVLDTATERGVFAIADGSLFLFHALLPPGIQTAQALLPKLYEALHSLDIDLHTLSYIATGVGPGSYTGIRVAATIAQTLAFACKLRLIGICTLDAFIPQQEGEFAVVIDAKIGGIYLQKGILRQGKVTLTTPPKVYALAEGVELLQDVRKIVTPNAEKIRPKLEELVSTNYWEWEERPPSCERLVQIAQEKMQDSNSSEFTLLYLRKTQAEIERENRS